MTSESTVTDDDFTSIPILNYVLLSSSDTRPVFIRQLQNALINVGFLYLENATPVPDRAQLFDEVIAYLPRIFALPQERKDAMRMINSPCFLGYSRLGVERTGGAADQREQFDFATPFENACVPGQQPEYVRLWGPNQTTFLRYLKAVENLSNEFTELVAEALGLPSDGLAQFYGSRDRIQHRSKIVKYPTRDEVASEQGVGPHCDGGFLTFVQNVSGEWINVPPRPYTFVINIGKGLEKVTQGLARATSHRVLAPAAGTSPRYSIPFFQNLAQDVRLNEHVLQFPPEVLKLKGRRGELDQTESVNCSEYDSLSAGQVHLFNRIKSHPDVAERHYPDLFKQFFPHGLPTHETVF
ncbi:Clavaminate synthase-like protein [Russula aff. rugulosa BPL654]|nr:Clavaminate synthase-like protein [Russula aff. rugulosa BPL654]